MRKKVTHKGITNLTRHYTFTVCGDNVKTKFTSYRWAGVTCKQCLKYKPTG